MSPTTQNRAARRFMAMTRVECPEPRPCMHCGAVFTPPVAHPGRSVCAECRAASRHQRQRDAEPRQMELVREAS